MPSHIAVVGAGMAGLSAAIALTQAGRSVTLIEAGPVAGGRCRSYFDRELGLRIDNGNHLLLSGNRAAFDYLDTIGARETLTMPDVPMFPFMDVTNGERRVAGTGIGDYLALLRLNRIKDDTPVASAMRDDTLYRRLIAPLAIAA